MKRRGRAGRLGYDPADPRSILAFGKRLIGRAARDIPTNRAVPATRRRLPISPRSKGRLGDTIEAYFGIRRNSSPRPDFHRAGVELKIMPLKRKGMVLDVKEPTSISMIDYRRLSKEVWAKATVRKKLENVLFVVFEIHPRDTLASTVKDVVLWSPRGTDNAVFEADWTRTRDFVRDGRAHELSESQAEALAARRKGKGGPDEPLRRQPAGHPLAKARAWALKTSFTRQLYREWSEDLRYRPVLKDADLVTPERVLQTLEDVTLSKVLRFKGWTIGQVASLRNIGLAARKDLAANIVKTALGFKEMKDGIREFEQQSIQIKTLNLSSVDGHPFEAVSLPAVDLKELGSETWEGAEDEDGNVIQEGAELADQLRRILFVPTFSPERSWPQEDRRIGEAFFWSPSEDEWRTIRAEWTMFRDDVNACKAHYDRRPGGGPRTNQLRSEDETRIIHMRPHARDSYDEGLDPKDHPVTRQSFWLNRKFVAELVRRAKKGRPPEEPSGGPTRTPGRFEGADPR